MLIYKCDDATGHTFQNPSCSTWNREAESRGIIEKDNGLIAGVTVTDTSGTSKRLFGEIRKIPILSS